MTNVLTRKVLLRGREPVSISENSYKEIFPLWEMFKKTRSKQYDEVMELPFDSFTISDINGFKAETFGGDSKKANYRYLCSECGKSNEASEKCTCHLENLKKSPYWNKDFVTWFKRKHALSKFYLENTSLLKMYENQKVNSFDEKLDKVLS